MTSHSRVSDTEGSEYEKWDLPGPEGDTVQMRAMLTNTHWRVFIYPPGVDRGSGRWVGMRQEPVATCDYNTVRASAVNIATVMFSKKRHG